MESYLKMSQTEKIKYIFSKIDTEYLSCMLAKDFKKEVHKIDWSGQIHVQPKFDGMRCLAFIKDHKVKLMSRDGKEITTMGHIADELTQLDDIIFDGELYGHRLNFQENMRLIKKYRKGDSENILYNIYDTVNDHPFHKRIVRSFIRDLKYSVEVSTYRITSEEELKQWHVKFLNDGYEGTMVRHGNDGYKVNGRSSSLLKYKDFIDITAQIVDVEPATQRPDWGQFVLAWPGASGHRLGENLLGCGMKFSHVEREEILKNKEEYIGKTAELRFFEYSETGVPRFPVVFGIRLDK